jgi:phosphoenolpyruvate-protein kinase (PTS system EI component)
MVGDREFLNEQTGETLTLDDYLAQQRHLEREITRFDAAIANLRADLSAAKKGKERAYADLRATVREIKALAPGARLRRVDAAPTER